MPELTEAWRPFEPTSKDPWDLRKVAHLHRRAGFGAGWKVLQQDVADGVDAATDRILNADQTDHVALETVASALKQGVRQGPDHASRLQAYWIYRILFSPLQLQERMTLFWHDHFATGIDKVRQPMLMLQQNELLRRLALGDLAELFNKILADPALLIWLDGANSPKERPNENLAREFFELFSLGVGNYSETDIREAARALTGWIQGVREYGSARLKFDPAQFDSGRKTIFRESGAWNASGLVDLTLQRPACAQFICRKLYRQFVRDDIDPPPQFINSLASVFHANNFSLRPVLATILKSRHFYESDSIRSRIAGPVELCVGLLRMLDVVPNFIRLDAIDEATRRQGQQLFHPPNVAGWGGGRNWITSTSMLERTNWVTDVIWGNRGFAVPQFDPVAWAERISVAPEDLGSVVLEVLLQGDHSSQAEHFVMELAKTPTPDNLRKALQVVVHTPEFQLV